MVERHVRFQGDSNPFQDTANENAAAHVHRAHGLEEDDLSSSDEDGFGKIGESEHDLYDPDMVCRNTQLQRRCFSALFSRLVCLFRTSTVWCP